jgi:hypothetical protein
MDAVYAVVQICIFVVYLVMATFMYTMCDVIYVGGLAATITIGFMQLAYMAALFLCRLSLCSMWFVVSGDVFLVIGAFEAQVAHDVTEWWKSRQAKQKQARQKQSSNKPWSRLRLWTLFSIRRPADSSSTTAAAGTIGGSNSECGKRSSTIPAGAPRKTGSRAHHEYTAAAASPAERSSTSNPSSRDSNLQEDESLAQLLTLSSVTRLQASSNAAAAAAAGGAAAAKARTKQGATRGPSPGHTLKSPAGNGAASSSSSSSRPAGKVLDLDGATQLLATATNMCAGSLEEQPLQALQGAMYHCKVSLNCSQEGVVPADCHFCR